jgi:hypothetical protein
MPCDGPSTPGKPGVIFCSECGEPMSHGTAKTEAGQPFMKSAICASCERNSGEAADKVIYFSHVLLSFVKRREEQFKVAAS